MRKLISNYIIRTIRRLAEMLRRLPKSDERKSTFESELSGQREMLRIYSISFSLLKSTKTKLMHITQIINKSGFACLRLRSSIKPIRFSKD